jgi:hypothetical protein
LAHRANLALLELIRRHGALASRSLDFIGSPELPGANTVNDLDCQTRVLTLKDFLAHWQTQGRQIIGRSKKTGRPKSFQDDDRHVWQESPGQIAGQTPFLKI